MATTYSGGGFSPNVNAKTYINGELKSMGANISVGTDGSALVVPTTPQVIYVGYGYAGAATVPDASYGNFRMFSKALNTDQVKELYDWQKDHFLGSRSSMTLYKGNLGLGVAEPSSRFEVAGDEQIQEYPPRAMTGNETYMEGHGVFRVEGDSVYSTLYPWEAFNDDITTNFGRWRQDTNQFTAGGGSVDSRAYASGLPNASWLVLHLPYDVNLKGYSICPQTGQSPGNIQIWGSNDGTSWSHLHSQTQTNGDNTAYQNYTISHKGHYSIIAYLILTLVGNTATEASIRNMQYYGTPAPSALEDGHLTLGKALTLPRVSGHAAGAETPRAESLIVHYDTTVDSVVSGSTVVDISGEGNNGTLSGGATYSSTDRALVFDGTGDFVKGTISSSLSGNHPYTFSLWIKPDAIQSNFIAVFEMGNRTTNQSCGLYLNGGSIVHLVFANNLATSTSVVPNQWIHITGTYTSGSRKIYADGVLLATDTYSSLNIGATEMTLGANNDDLQKFDGSISNFKLYDVALTAEEVAMEYALGRTGKSVNLTDTSLCLGGTVPRAQLDVRGTGMFDGGLVIKYKNSLEYARDGGIMMSRAGLGNVTNKYSSQPIILDGGDSGAIDGNLRGGAIWSQWGGSQYGIAMRGASLGDTYPYLQDPALFVTKDNVGIGTANPAAKLDVNGYILNNNPAFHAYKTGGASTTNTGAFNAFTDVFLNRGGHYYTSGGNVGKFIAPVAGVYYFSANMLHRQAGANGSGEITFYKNGTNISSRAFGYTYVSAGSDHDNLHIETMIELAVNDYVQVAIHSLGSSTNFYYGEGLANFRGFLIG